MEEDDLAELSEALRELSIRSCELKDLIMEENREDLEDLKRQLAALEEERREIVRQMERARARVAETMREIRAFYDSVALKRQHAQQQDEEKGDGSKRFNAEGQ